MTDSTRGVVHADSRWWYWIAALPGIVALWAASAVWVLLGVSLEFGLGGGGGTGGTGGGPGGGTGGGGIGGIGGQSLLLLPAIALGAPALVAFLILPIALWRDGEAVRRSGGWPDLPLAWAAIAGLVDVVLLAGLVLLAQVDRTLGLIVLLLAVVSGTSLAVVYLRRRARHVWTPTTLWELKRELEPR